jgi:uncharacterized membrane protein (DUF106 family)
MTAWLPVLPLNIEILIVVMAIIYTSISIIAQRKLANTKRMRQIQAKVSILQKEMSEMMKRNAPQEELMAKQKEFMPLMGEQMKNSMKPMLVILPLLLITYYLIIPNLPISATNLGSSKELFFILVFGIGMVSAIAILIYDRMLIKKEMQVQTAASANPSQQQNNQ